MIRIKFFFMKWSRKSIGWLILYIIFIIISLKIGYYLIGKNGINEITVNSDDSSIHDGNFENLQSCPIPDYDDFQRYPKNRTLLTDLKCPIQDDLVSVENGIVYLLTNSSCTYQCIKWKSDFDYELKDHLPLRDSQSVPCSFFIVKCQMNDNNKVKEQIVFNAKRSKDLIDRSSKKLNGKPKPKDVIVIGIDSMAYKAYQYYLPKTFAALHNELDGVSFKKFNTMGDGTTVNVQAFLTGTKDTETYEARRRIPGSKTVDNFNWIWKFFKENGYVTLYSEEMTDYGTFQYRLNGFEYQPTDFYLRIPFMVAEKKGFYKNFCLGSRPMHTEYFKFFNEFSKAYHDVPKFSFVFFSYMSHDDNKYVSYMDNELAQFIVDTRKNNPDALMILYSDHGHRFTSRLTMEGKYEERLPFLGISLPKSWEHLKPVLLKNSDILISGLDLHATLEDVIGIYTSTARSRHMSLIRPLPNDRKCEDIESLPHWCSCLNWQSIANPNSNEKLTKTAESIVEIISEFTDSDRELCAKLKLDKILVVYRLDAQAAVLKFKQSADVDGFVPDLSDKVRQTKHLYRMTVKTKPGNAEFDLTVSVDEIGFTKGSKIFVDKFRPEDVSRINRFAPWITCLSRRKKVSTISDIRKFCICKDVL